MGSQTEWQSSPWTNLRSKSGLDARGHGCARCMPKCCAQRVQHLDKKCGTAAGGDMPVTARSASRVCHRTA